MILVPFYDVLVHGENSKRMVINEQVPVDSWRKLLEFRKGHFVVESGDITAFLPGKRILQVDT